MHTRPGWSPRWASTALTRSSFRILRLAQELDLHPVFGRQSSRHSRATCCGTARRTWGSQRCGSGARTNTTSCPRQNRSSAACQTARSGPSRKARPRSEAHSVPSAASSPLRYISRIPLGPTMWFGPIPSNLSDSLRATNFQTVESHRCGCGAGAVRGWRASALHERSRKQLARACRLERALPRRTRGAHAGPVGPRSVRYPSGWIHSR